VENGLYRVEAKCQGPGALPLSRRVGAGAPRSPDSFSERGLAAAGCRAGLRPPRAVPEERVSQQPRARSRFEDSHGGVGNGHSIQFRYGFSFILLHSFAAMSEFVSARQEEVGSC